MTAKIINQISPRLALVCAIVGWLSCWTTFANAQLAGGGGVGNIGNQAQAGQGIRSGGNQGGGAGGIAIDADGLLTASLSPEGSDKLALKRMEATARQHLRAEVMSSSPLRKVSLPRLERFLQKFADEKQSAPVEAQFLAGLQRVDYVFLYPDSGDLVIAGPAEGFASNSAGRVVGVVTGRPTLRLDDLLVALRANGQRGSTIGCSIDPIPEKLAQMVAASKQNNGPANPQAIQQRYKELTKILGEQVVTVNGVSADSHLAQVMVEADYRMKLMAVGVERPKVAGFKSALDLQRPGDLLYQRWWFTPSYDALRTTSDGLAYRFAGQRLQLLSQDEFINSQGQRSGTNARRSTEKYAQQFTELLPQIATASPVFAELQNITDLLLVTSLIRRERLAHRANWKQSLFLNEDLATVKPLPVPKHVPSIGNAKRAGQLMLGIVGGVTVNADETLQRLAVDQSQTHEIDGLKSKAAVPTDASIWWWD